MTKEKAEEVKISWPVVAVFEFPNGEKETKWMVYPENIEVAKAASVKVTILRSME